MNARYLARRMAMQALYQWSMAGGGVEDIAAIEQQYTGYNQDTKIKADLNYFSTLLHGVLAELDELDRAIDAAGDLEIARLNPIELALLRIGTFELTQQPDVPLPVVINELVEIAKAFGATNSFRYINAVLDKLAADTRADTRAASPPAVTEAMS